LKRNYSAESTLDGEPLAASAQVVVKRAMRCIAMKRIGVFALTYTGLSLAVGKIILITAVRLQIPRDN